MTMLLGTLGRGRKLCQRPLSEWRRVPPGCLLFGMADPESLPPFLSPAFPARHKQATLGGGVGGGQLLAQEAIQETGR